jgi:hypothetical protein
MADLKVMPVSQNSDVAIDCSSSMQHHLSFCNVTKQILEMVSCFKSVQFARKLQHLLTPRSLVSWVQLHCQTTDSGLGLEKVNLNNFHLQKENSTWKWIWGVTQVAS